MCIAAGDADALQRLAQYMARCPFSLARLLRITPEGKVIYKADKEHCREYPLPAEDTLFGGVARNYQVFEPLDFLAELTQHIPNQGEHLIRYYGCYSNKARGQAVTRASCPPDDQATRISCPSAVPAPPSANIIPDRLARRRWAMLIQRIYHIDPLICPKCGGTMKIIAFVEARQDEVIRKILEHCGLWHAPPLPPPRAPPPVAPRSQSIQSQRGLESSNAVEMDPEYLEHLHHKSQADQLEMPWEP